MKYFLRTLGESPELLIDNEKYSLLRESKRILGEAFKIEEEYEMVVLNYIDLEKEAINFSISYMVRTYRGYIDHFDARIALNIRLMNLLTSIRLYKDRLSTHCGACLPQETGVKERVDLLFSTEYDNNFDFRFMEALRNYSQHYDTPVHVSGFGGRRTSLDDSGQFEYYSNFTVTKQLLISDGHFKRPILDEMPDEVNLISASRGYIEAVSSVHDSVRKMISDSVKKARSLIQSTLDDYKAIYKKDIIGLNAYAFDGDKEMDEISLFLNWDDIRIQLIKRNNQLGNLKKRYVTGQIQKK
jgi:hypothetical protein